MKFVSKFTKTENVEYSWVRVFRGNMCVENGWVKTELVNDLVDFIRADWKENNPKAKISFVIDNHGVASADSGILEYVKA